jgi:23S rRNA (guanosine2251-2'-O)-methyltransferase
MPKGSLYLILHDIRSAHNVGALFRTASGAGVEKVVLCGYTGVPAAPNKMFLTRAEKDLAKTALGAEYEIPYEQKSIQAAIEEAKKEGYFVIGLEQRSTARPYTTKPPKTKVALVVGTEVTGIPEDVQAMCDALYEIPMYGQKNSLNVAVATGVALYALRESLEKV